ncbi:protein kinase 2B, chloroplastic-like [Gossypium australe]|uniref:Protein kinase 2B, chloroplastic-like n=1 Tax=Gossypium australe TaxID=47621 RepID=A0A5B6VI64_9ROSI|nr:protein kinase 2B, chloroplastic-like [Gossypium australe]
MTRFRYLRPYLNERDVARLSITASKTCFQKVETKLEALSQEFKDQFGQLAKQISERPQGRLPSNTETNPREQVQAVTAQDSEGLDEPNLKQKNVVEEDMVEVNKKSKPVIKEYKPSIPYPQAITKDDTEEQFDLGKSKQTRMSIQLADKTIRVPKGIIEDVLVKIDKFVFPVDFVVLDMDEDNAIPLILGRPFLAIARTKIDVDVGELILCVGDETITLQALDSTRTLNRKSEKVNSIDNYSVNPSFQEALQKNTTESDPSPCANKEITHKEQGIQIDEIKEGKMHLNTSKEIPFKVINVFPYGTVEISRPHGRGRGRVGT